SGEEGKKDLLDAIAVSKYTGMPVDPAALAKLVAAGTLSQADLDKLARGEKVQIPAGQMAYLYQMSQSLNGMSPEQIKELQRTLPA
ncbi:TPR repeat region-containing protein, partial [Mycobacteroides abscessus]